MLRLALGALAAGILMFFWGFLYWGVGLGDPFTHLSQEGETAIATSIKDHTARHGLYVIPDPKIGTEAEWAARSAQGPFAMLYVKPTGAEVGAPMTMMMGLVHMVLTATLVGVIIMLTLGSAPGWLDRFKIAALVGITGTFFGVFSQPIWWHHAWDVALVFAVYDLIAYLIAGAVMAFAIKPT